ncbi:MAG: DUF6290 family protein [Eubacteriales bacterium]
MEISIMLSEDEEHLIKFYAKLNSISIEEAFKRALFEKIEEEYDIVVADTSYKQYLSSGCQSGPVDELWKELDL